MTSPHYDLVDVVPPNPTTLRGQSAKLSLSPNGDVLVYCNGRSVVVRPVPGLSATSPPFLYSQHPHPVTVARISPSGAYVASADASGLVRIWDLLGGDQVLKAEYRPFAGSVRDLAWDTESKRIALVGEGKERFGHFFLVDTGSSCGEVSGHAKVINSVAIKPQRPFKAVTASDDTNLVFYAGVPFKYAATLTQHTRFVQAVAYAPTGTHFASAGSDGKIHLYDGTTGAHLSTLDVGTPSTVFDLVFAADGKQLLSAGADGIARLWHVEAAAPTLAAQWDLKAGLPNAGDQLVGITLSHATGTAIALNLAGQLITFDVADAAIKGRYMNPTRGIAAAVQVSRDNIVAASWDGNVYSYLRGPSAWEVQVVQGFTIGGPVVTALALDGTDKTVYVAAMDDVLRRIVDGNVDPSFSAPLPSACKALSISASTRTLYALTSTALLSLPLSSSSPTLTSHALPLPTPSSSPSALALSPGALAIGTDSGHVLLYALSSTSSLDDGPTHTLSKNRSGITSLAFNSSGTLLACADSTGKIPVLAVSPAAAAAAAEDEPEPALKLSQWVFHTARVPSLVFEGEGESGGESSGEKGDQAAVSAGLDTHLFVWSTARPTSKREVRNAHAGGAVWAGFVRSGGDGGEEGRETIASLGSDGAFKVWRRKD